MISKQDIKKLSELARIEVTESEIEQLELDLERVLVYVERLNAAEIGAVEELGNIVSLHTIMREDEDTDENIVKGNPVELVEAARWHEDGFIKTREIWKERK